jgi:hypothetical protein
MKRFRSQTSIRPGEKLHVSNIIESVVPASVLKYSIARNFYKRIATLQVPAMWLGPGISTKSVAEYTLFQKINLPPKETVRFSPVVEVITPKLEGLLTVAPGVPKFG